MNYNEKLELYIKAVEMAGFTKKGKTMPYTSANGHMFSLLNKDGELGIRFSKEDQEKYISKLKTTTFKSHGATMRGYILMPDKMWSTLKPLAKYLQESHSYVMSLDPK